MTTGAYGPNLPVSVEQARTLPTAEVAIRLLRFAQTDLGQWANNRLDLGIDTVLIRHGDLDADDAKALTFKLVEAWDWLHHRGLVAVMPGTDRGRGQANWYVTERGAEVSADPRALDRLQAEARLGIDLHPSISDRVQAQYALGEYELAAFLAMKEVEIRVRGLGRYGDGDFGVKLMRAAFNVDGGLLTDPGQIPGEQQATSDLYAGAIGVFKNPTSHRRVDFDDPVVASEIVILADLLLRMLDATEERQADGGGDDA